MCVCVYVCVLIKAPIPVKISSQASKFHVLRQRFTGCYQRNSFKIEISQSPTIEKMQLREPSQPSLKQNVAKYHIERGDALFGSTTVMVIFSMGKAELCHCICIL